MTQENGNGVIFQSSGRITNKELWHELQQLRTEVAVLASQHQHTASEVEKIKKQQDEFLRVANENLLEHERILSSLNAIGVKIGFWAVVSGAAVSLIWNIIVSPLLKP